MRVYERPVRFEEVDAAQIVFFPRFLTYCHEAMEALFDDSRGATCGSSASARWASRRCTWSATSSIPCATATWRGSRRRSRGSARSSVSFRYAISRASDETAVASILHVCAVSDLVALKAIPIPDDVRAALERHLVTR